MNLPKNIQFCLDRLNECGYKSYVVGGSVRDSVMNHEIGDFDVTTSALPSQTEKCFENYKIIETGIKHGTVTVLIDDCPIEITTFRIDGEYRDNRHPDDVKFTPDIIKDLSRRDFTVNALCYNPHEGLIDEFGGIDDIKNRIIRCVGDPETRFKEDALRIIRALRFSSTLDFEIEKETSIAIKENASLLKNVAVERVSVELLKLLCGKNVRNILLEYAEVFFEIIPELKSEYHFEQHGEKHFYDVWGHTCKTVENIDPDPILRLTMLLHDCGKPKTHALDENGNSTFKSHAAVGGVIAEKIVKNLKLSNFYCSTVCYLVSNHDKKVPTDKYTVKKYLREMGSENFLRLMKIRKADRGALSPKYRDIIEQYNNAVEMYEEIQKNREPYTLKDLDVDGRDLKKIGIVGKKTGDCLEYLLDEVMKNSELNDKSILLEMAEKYNEGEN